MIDGQIMVYHGEDIVSSRKAFVGHLESLGIDEYEVLRINGKKLDEETLELSSGPNSLFGKKRVLAIDGLFSGGKSKEKEIVFKLLFSIKSPVIIWEGKELGKTDCMIFPKNTVFNNHRIPVKLYNFLDSIFPGRKEENIRFFNQMVEVIDINFLFLMLVRQVRLLIMAKDDTALSKMASWQSAKLKAQSSRFEEEKLSEIYRKLLDIDYRQKTSSSPFDLKASLDLWLMEI